MSIAINWLRRQYEDIKGNAKWALLYWLVLGSGLTWIIHHIQYAYHANIAGWLALAAPIFSILAVLYLVWIVSSRMPPLKTQKVTDKLDLIPVPAPQLTAPAKLPQPPRQLPVDLRGEIEEIYFQKQAGLFLLTLKMFIVMKVRIVNHGPDDATITHIALSATVGRETVECTVMNAVPSAWRIKRQKAGSFFGETVETTISPDLPPNEIYEKGIPHSGWLAFECMPLKDCEFPNAEFKLHLKDSLGGIHTIRREAMIYYREGEIVASTAATPPLPSTNSSLI